MIRNKLFIFLLIIFPCFTNAEISSTDKLAHLSKIWGFLKYHHPEVVTGKHDWDKVLIKAIPLVLKSQSKEELNKVYAQLYIPLGPIKPNKPKPVKDRDTLCNNVDLTWIEDTTILSASVSKALLNVYSNRTGQQYYTSIDQLVPEFTKNELAYPDSVYPGVQGRLLTLFRYWNIIEYFFPYKKDIGRNWNHVLCELIPLFQNASDIQQYHLALMQMVASVNDTHAQFTSSYTATYFGKRIPPFEVLIIDSVAVIKSAYNDSLFALTKLQRGDKITHINGTPLPDLIHKQSKYIGASNNSVMLAILSRLILNGSEDSVLISFKRDELSSARKIKRYKMKELQFKPVADIVYRDIDSNTCVIDMGVLTPKETEDVLEKATKKKAIIFDVRNYPKGTMYAICNALKSEKSPFARFTDASIEEPGVFKDMGIVYCGTKRQKGYGGKVVILANYKTQSHAEFTCMALKTIKGSKLIGSQTSGADGNVTHIMLPGNYKVRMTALGVFYPDGSPTQRIGIKPDITVLETADGIREGRDEVLERALEYLRTDQ